MLVMLFALLIAGGLADTRYNTTAKVYSQENDVTLLVDGAGYVWAVMDRPDLTIGDFVTIYFDNNCTDYTRKDDKILKIKRLDN